MEWSLSQSFTELEWKVIDNGCVSATAWENQTCHVSCNTPQNTTVKKKKTSTENQPTNTNHDKTCHQCFQAVWKSFCFVVQIHLGILTKMGCWWTDKPAMFKYFSPQLSDQKIRPVIYWLNFEWIHKTYPIRPCHLVAWWYSISHALLNFMTNTAVSWQSDIHTILFVRKCFSIISKRQMQKRMQITKQQSHFAVMRWSMVMVRWLPSN